MKTTNEITIENLQQLNPCESGYEFAKSKNSLIDAWNTCERGDLMLWFAQKLGCPLQLLTLAKATCAETVLHLMSDERSRKAVKVAIDFSNGVASREELSEAASDAAKAAAEAAYDYAAAEAAYDYAAEAADAAAEAAEAAYDYVYAAAAAANAAADAAEADEDAYASNAAEAAAEAAVVGGGAAAADAARKANQHRTANICREILTDFIKTKI